MNTITHTLIALLFMSCAYAWGYKKGDWSGSITMTKKFIEALHKMDILVKLNGDDVFITSAFKSVRVKNRHDEKK